LIWFQKKAIYSNARPPAFDQQCPCFGITDVHVHAAFRRWQAWLGRTHPDISRPCLSHHVQCSTAHALVPFENPFSSDRHGADGAGRRTGRIRSRTDRRATGKRPFVPGCPAQPEHAQTLHERTFRILWLPHLQLDELRTRLRSANQILWLWLAIDPLTKIVPVLELGPRTQTMAHRLILSLRQILAPGCVPLFTSDGLHLYFYAPPRPLWPVACIGSSRAQRAPLAGGGWPDLRPGEKMLPTAQVGTGHPCHASWDPRMLSKSPYKDKASLDG
jgi:hypothetical protein